MSDDSLFYTNFRFRMQNRLRYSNVIDDLSNDVWEAQVRRLRIRMDGFIYTRRISYSVQLAFTRNDQDFDETGIINIVRDAVMFYNFSDDFYASFGQHKLPGNRQRVNSSGSLQFAERSLVNSAFNIDRDFAVMLHLNKKIGDMPIQGKAAVSTGEGRVASTTDNGLAYTGRLEFLPLGDFTNGGDYSEGDLEREETPKLSIGGGYSYNDRTTRVNGQKGFFVTRPFTLKTAYFDAIFKYNGLAYTIEYMHRDTENPLNTTDDDEARMIYTYKGWGVNQQLSYLLNHGYEVAARYTHLEPHRDIAAYESQTEVIELGLTKYLKAHRLKFQVNANYNFQQGMIVNYLKQNAWGATFQVELGI